MQKNYTIEYSGALNRTYTYLNLLDLEQVRLQLNKEDDFSIDEDTILSTYQGHTIFSIFLQRFEVYEQILSQLEEKKYEDELNILRKLSENTVLRRLYRILCMPTAEIVVNKLEKMDSVKKEKTILEKI